MGLREEIFEQPRVLGQLLESAWAPMQKIAKAIRERSPQFVYVVARGSSDNAGLYAKYLLGIKNGLPVALAVPSLFTMYKSPPKIGGALVIGISQSGRSPDIIEAVAEGRRQGAITVVITNSPQSPLAKEGEFVIDIATGKEEAVAATKTYTAQLLAIAMLSAALSRRKEQRHALDAIPDLVAQCLAPDLVQSLARISERYRYMEQCVVLGRGFNYATAYEWALKLKEMTYVVAEPYSSADFQHGPIAIVEQGFPVLVIACAGAVGADMLGLARHLNRDKGAELVLVTNIDGADQIAERTFMIPEAEEWLTPIFAMVPAQIFTYALTLSKGLDPEHPRGLHKVTSTE